MTEPVEQADTQAIGFMRQALKLADESVKCGDVPVGAVVVYEGRVVGEGINTREQHGDPTGHAEMMAIRQAAAELGTWRLQGCTVVVTLEPCAMCAGAMVLARVARCVFGCTDPRGGFLGTLGNLAEWPGLNHRFDVVAGVLASESQDRLQSFFRRLRQGKVS